MDIFRNCPFNKSYFDALAEVFILVTLGSALPPKDPALWAGDLGLFPPLEVDLVLV